jgi:arylformamidase
LGGEKPVDKSDTHLTRGAAEFFVSKKVRAVGIDFLSVEKFKASNPVAHKTLLGKGIFIIESLSSAVKQFLGTRVLLICLPIKLRGGDGSPSRVIAVPTTPN